MNEVTISKTIFQPEVDDHERSYTKFLCNTPKKRRLFELITEPECIFSALVVVEETGRSPIAVFESRISYAISISAIEPLDSHEKQYVGTVACTIMESNGWKKTNRKQRFSTGIFKSAEIYEKAA